MRDRREKSVFDFVAGQETQLAILGMVVRALYTVHGIWNVLHYDAIQKALESYGSYYGIWQNMVEHCPELDG